MEKFRKIMKIIWIVIYSVIYFAFGICTIFLFFILTPPWRKISKSPNPSTKLDPYTKEAIYYDMIDD